MAHATEGQQSDAQKRRAADEDALWSAFVAQRRHDQREALARFYLPFAKQLAAKLYAGRTVAEVEFADYYQHAVIGLLEAIDRYDSTIGCGFKSYAQHRIRGAVLTAAEKLTERSEQIAFKREVARERAYSLKTIIADADRRDAFEEMVDVAIGLAIGFLLQDSGMYRREEGAALDYYGSDELVAAAERMQEMLAVLTPGERAVVEYHYIEEMRFTVIADILKVTRGRISQLHASAIQKLRCAYEALEDTDLRI
jgi:RNA polymerase sigma factor for flagellar operon FliA